MATISRILVPVDLGELSARTLDYAKMVALPFSAALVLIHVVPNPYVTSASDVYLPPPQDFLDELEREATARLGELLPEDERARFKADRVVQVGDPACEIVNYARAHAVDLIVMGTHGRKGISHLVLGSVAERVLRTAPCPVLVLR